MHVLNNSFINTIVHTSLNRVTSQLTVDNNSSCTATSVEVNLHPGFKAEFDLIGDALGNLLHTIAPLIETAIPSLSDFKAFLRRCRPQLKIHLEHTHTFNGVMELIEGECSVINITILESIVNKYSIHSARDYILAYQTNLDDFCHNSLTLCCNYQFKRLSLPLLTCETIKFILKWNPDEHSLTNIKGLLWKAFKDNKVDVVVVKEGSVIVLCYAPLYLMESLLLVARNNLDLLKEMKLQSLIIGYHTVYEETVINEVSLLVIIMYKVL